MKKIFFITLVVILLLRTFIECFSDEFWMPTDGPYASKISKIVIDTNKNVIYLATKTDGIYKSSNNGISWSSTKDATMGLHTMVSDLVVGPTGTLYAATDSLGVFRKISNQSWVKKTVTNNPVLHCIYLLKNGDLLAGTNISAVAKSQNDGNNWNLSINGLSSIIDVYAIIQANNDNVLIGTDKGIYKSSDNGQNWTSADNNPGKVNCFAKSSDGLVILAGSDNGIWGSTNNGDTWVSQSSGMPANTKVISLAYHKDGYFIAGTETAGLFQSHPSTKIWSAYNTGLEAMKIRAVATSQLGEFYCGTNFAFYKSPDNSSGWTSYNSGLGLRTINRFASLANRADVLAATDLGIYRTTNSGDSWNQLNQGLGDFLDVAAIVAARNGTLFAGTKGDGLYFSTNLGDSWSKLNDPDFTATWVTTLDTNSKGILWAGTKTKGVYKSDDMTGMTWSSQNGDGIETKEILSFVVAANDVTYAGTANDGLYRKADAVNFWSKVDPGQFGIGLNTIHALSYTSVGANGIIYAATNSGIRRSTDNSLGPWYSPSGSLPGAAIAITSCENGWVLVGVKNATGVFIDDSTMNGDKWRLIPATGLNSVQTQTLAVSGRGYIFAGTIGGGCYRSVESTSGKILKISTNQDDTVHVQQGDNIDFSITVVDGGGNLIPNVTLTVENDMGLTIGDLTTDASGVATTQITIPSDLPDSPKNTYYRITFVGSKINYLESEYKIVYLDVHRKKIILDIEPKTEQDRDWEQVYEYNIIAMNDSNQVLPNMTINVFDSLLNSPATLTTDAEGKAEYKKTVPDNHPEKKYGITFVGEDPTAYYFSSDTAKRTVNVKNNPIKIIGEKIVCVKNDYTYATEPLANTTYIWKDINGGSFLSPTSNTYVDIRWDTTGQGGFTLEQKVGNNVPTTRQYLVTISDLPVVTMDDFTDPVCPNEPFDLSTVTVSPPGGVFSGPGVTNGIFSGEDAGSAGPHPITYTYTSDVEPYCTDSVTKDIIVNPLPNVTLNLPSTDVCLSDFPFLLTGSNQDATGKYSGKGVSDDNMFDPAVAGVGTWEITITYTDETTGCTNTAKQDITVNDAPSTSFDIAYTNICESETAFDLSDKINPIEPGTFSGPGVDNAKKIFNAQAAGLGTHRIVFVTDRVDGSCPGRTYIDLEVVPVPGTPTLSWGGPSGKVVWLASNVKSGNYWYRWDANTQKDTLISIDEGRNNDTIRPEISGLYTVTVNNGTCESFHSNSYDFKVSTASGSFTTKSSESGEIKPGKSFNVAIMIGDVTDIFSKKINKVTTELVYNASVLYPEDSNKGTIINGWRHIPLTITFNPDSISQGDEMTKLTFTALVGSEESTNLRFDSVLAWKDNKKKLSNIGINTIEIKIKVNRNGGKPRLYGQPPVDGGFLYSSIMPNPAGETFRLDYSTEKGNWINIYITNVNGQILKTIYEGEAKEENSIDIDASELQTGVYYLIMQTPYVKEAKLLQIIR
ncbi:MAG: T9SS type A sorting domain-containing protein [bacterium]